MEMKEILENSKDGNCKYNLEDSKKRLLFWSEALVSYIKYPDSEEGHMKDWLKTIKDNIDYFYYVMSKGGNDVDKITQMKEFKNKHIEIATER